MIIDLKIGSKQKYYFYVSYSLDPPTNSETTNPKYICRLKDCKICSNWSKIREYLDL